MTTPPQPVPEWLAAWRERQGVSVLVQSAVVYKPTEQARRAQTRRTDNQGFHEPREWPQDKGTRREAVLDTDHNPPRVIRYVGWRSCMRCRRAYFSPDVRRVRMCPPCKDSNT